MSDQTRPETQVAPTLGRTVRLLTAVAIGASFLFLSGLTLTGTVIALIAAAPLLVLFSPILVPAGIGVCLATAGFFFSGGCVVVALAALSWVYNFVAGKHPPAADYARMRIADMKERAKGFGQHVQPKAEEATQGS